MINQRIVDAGVAWHLCSSCERLWPFPMGVPPGDSRQVHEDREWICQVCAEERIGRIVRRVRETFDVTEVDWLP